MMDRPEALVGLGLNTFLIEVLRYDCKHRSGLLRERNESGRCDGSDVAASNAVYVTSCKLLKSASSAVSYWSLTSAMINAALSPPWLINSDLRCPGVLVSVGRRGHEESCVLVYYNLGDPPLRTLSFSRCG